MQVAAHCSRTQSRYFTRIDQNCHVSVVYPSAVDGAIRSTAPPPTWGDTPNRTLEGDILCWTLQTGLQAATAPWDFTSAWRKELRGTPPKRAEHASINACMPGYGKPWVNTNQHTVNMLSTVPARVSGFPSGRNQWSMVDSVRVWSYQDSMQLMQVKEAPPRANEAVCLYMYSCIQLYLIITASMYILAIYYTIKRLACV